MIQCFVSRNGKTSRHHSAGGYALWLLLLLVGAALAIFLFMGRRAIVPVKQTDSQLPSAPVEQTNQIPNPASPEQPASEADAAFEQLGEAEKASLLSSKGEELLAAKQYPAAAAAFRESLKYDPLVETVHYNLGIACARMDLSKEAIAAYKEALKLAPDYAEAHNNLGNILVKLGRLEEAATHFQEAIRINPEDALGYNNLGTLLARQRRVSEAADHFVKAVNLSPKYLEARYNLGNCYIELGQVQDAVREFNEILRIDPQYAPAHQGLARARRAVTAR